METIGNMIHYLVGVYIVEFDGVLTIEDRRPTQKMGVSVGGLAIVSAMVLWGWLSASLIVDAFTITMTVIMFSVGLFFIARENFREVYIFDKKTDSYTFTRQSLIRRDVMEGTPSQFRAVQVEKRLKDDRDGADLLGDIVLKKDSRSGSPIYMTALLMQGLLLGQSDTLILRNAPPFISTQRTESRIANAIGKFLDIPREGIVDVL
jgi:hypothetical protein